MFGGRYFHAGSISETGEIFVFGGCTGDNYKLNDLCVFTPEDQFRRVPVSQDEEKPSKRDFHTVSVVGGQLFVVGGTNGKGEKEADIWSFSLPSPAAYSLRVSETSQTSLQSSFESLLSLASENHEASDLELFCKNEAD